MNATSEALPFVKRTIQLPVLALVMALTISATFFYPGSKPLFLIYGLLVTAMVRVILTNRSSFFVLFLFSFLTLGFWAKLIKHLLLGTSFIEPTGSFDGSPAAWDAALIVMIAAFGSLFTAYTLVSTRHNKAFEPSASEKPMHFLGPLLVLAIVSTVGLLGFNYYFSILKIGTEPTLKLNSYVYVVIAFMVAWGNAILLAALMYWLIKAGRAKPILLFYVISLEGALAAMSMGSRAQMILHAAVPFAVYSMQATRLGWKNSRMDWLKIALVTSLMFVMSIIVVSADRLSSFAKAVPVAITATVTIPDSPEIAQKQTSKLSSQLSTPTLSVEPAPAPVPVQPTPSIEVQIAQRKGMLFQLTKLVVDRWIGLEGILTVSSEKGRDMQLFRDGLNEDPNKGTKAIYQRMSNSQYAEFENFTFMTIPGPVAMLYYSGSHLVVISGMAFLFFLGFYIEAAATKLLHNAAASGIIGAALAYLVVQTSFPKTLFFFILELIMFVIGLAVLKGILSRWRKLPLVAQSSSC